MKIMTMRQLAELLLPYTIEQAIREEIDPKFQWDYSAKSLESMMNVVDIVDLIMKIELRYGVDIPDDLAEKMISGDPQPMMMSYWRDKRLGELGIQTNMMEGNTFISEERMAEIREKAEELMLNMAALYVQARDAKEFKEDPMPVLERIGAALEEALAAIPDSPIDGEEIENLLSAAERDAKISQALGKSIK
jgi:acyl carrier protein